MGLFDSKQIITVSTSINRVIEDSLLPDSIITGMTKGLFLQDDQSIEHVLEDLSQSIGIKAERMYQYGKNGYPYGVPTSQLIQRNSLVNVVRGVLSSQEGHSVSIEYANFGALNNLHYGWTALVSLYDYNPDTNELTVLSASKGYPVYLEDLQVVVVEASLAELNNGSLDQWGAAATAGYTPLRSKQSAIPRPHTPFGVDPVAISDYLIMSYIWVDTANDNTIIRETLNIPNVVYVPEDEYFQVKYSYSVTVDTITTVHTKYFSYLEGSGAYPELDAIYSTEYNDLGSFFPIGYFRFNNIPTSTNTASTEYKAAKKLMNYLGMKYIDVNTAINANPDIGEVESALLMMAVPAETTSAIEQRYLFDFFKNLYLKSGSIGLAESEQGNTIALGLQGNHTPDAIAMVIQDTRFKCVLSMSGIYRHIRVGVISKLHGYSSGKDTIDYTKDAIRYDPILGGEPYTWTSTGACHYYRKQITETLYEEIQVFGLSLTNYVWGGYTTTSTMIPIDRAITTHYGTRACESLYGRSLHYIFNSKHITKVAWYQQSWFRIVLIIVAIVITIFDFGADGGSVLGAAILAGTVTLEMIINFALTLAFEYFMSKVVFPLFVKIIGADAALFLAVVLVCVASFSGGSSLTGIQGSPWAKELLSVATNLAKAVPDVIGDKMLSLQTEADSFNIKSKEQTALLDETRKLLESNHLQQPLIVFGELPADLYKRTVHSGNIGVIGIEAISSYVDISLTLPTFSQTLGEQSYG